MFFNLDKIKILPYSKISKFTFEELYRIAYNFVLYGNIDNIKYINSTESNIEYLITDNNANICLDNNADTYLKKIYNVLDSRICIFNNIQEICDISLYATRTKKNTYDYKLLLEELYKNKKYKQNIIILLLQQNNINEDVIKKILFTQIIKNT